MTFENTLLVDDMLHKSMFNLPYSVIFFKIDGNHLLNIILLYLESLHFFGMRVYKFIELNPFGSIIDMAFGDPQYEKLNVRCFVKCNKTFYNKVQSRFINKKR
jgi:hypothetical protein